ncbi:MAG TPA: hypothetical protein VGM42_08335 [Rhodopila sp.]
MTISTTYPTGVTLSSVSYDPTTITSTGRLEQGLKTKYAGEWQVLNQGTIQAPSGNGIYLLDGGTVTNDSGAYIGGTDSGIIAFDSPVTVVNAGRIHAIAGDGIFLHQGGAVTNQAALFEGFDRPVEMHLHLGGSPCYPTFAAAAGHAAA